MSFETKEEAVIMEDTQTLYNGNLTSSNDDICQKSDNDSSVNPNLSIAKASDCSSNLHIYDNLREGYTNFNDDRSQRQRDNENIRTTLKSINSVNLSDHNDSNESVTDKIFNTDDIDLFSIAENKHSLIKQSTDNEFVSSNSQESQSNQSESSVISSTVRFSPNDNLFYSVMIKDLDSIKSLVKFADEDTKDYNGRNLFQLACCEGHYEMVEYFISLGYNVNKVIDNGDNETVLHVSVYYVYKDIIELLLRNNIDTTIRSTKGSTAFHYSATYDKLEILQYFIENKIYINLYEIDFNGLNIMDLACFHGHYKIIEYLLSIKYDVNMSILSLLLSVIKGHKRVVELLINLNIDINMKPSKFGRSALHVASEHNQLDILKYFIDNNIYNNIYDIDNDGNNIFYLSSGKGNYNIIEYLLSIGYDINTTNNENISALHISVSHGHKRIVELLLNYNIDTNIKETKYGRSALHVASELNQLDILKYFIDNNIYNNIYDIDNNGNNIFHLSCLIGKYNIIEYLLSIGYDINTTNNENRSALHISVDKGHKVNVELLLKRNIDINIKESKCSRSALHFSSEFNQLDILKYFIDNNIYNNIYDIDNEGCNIFHLSCGKGNYNIIEYLLSIGYDINTTDNKNRSAFHYSVVFENIAIVELLLNNKIDINIKDINGQSPLDYALRYNRLDMYNYLIDNKIYKSIQDIDSDGNNL